MHGEVSRRGGITSARLLGVAAVAAMAVVLAACQPVGIGNPGAKIGNDLNPANCPGLQPSTVAPCGPQPMLWASINGPFDNFANGDPYSTRCASGGGSGLACTQGNTTYRTTGYAYAIDVAAADVGKSLTLQGYDVGVYPRTVGTGPVGAAAARDIDDLTTTYTSTTVTSATANFTAADVGSPITSSLLAGGFIIRSVVNATTATLSAQPTGTGVNAATIGYDCNKSVAPWNNPSFSGIGGSNCQTGDDTDLQGQNVDVQVYDNDGSGGPSFANALAGCHFSHSGAELAAARTVYKNKWVDLCTFTPAKSGTYAFRFRNSGIDGMTDVGQGNNQYALKVNGGSATGLHAVTDQSIVTDFTGSVARTYLADVPSTNAGKKLVVDLFDPGDGFSSSNFVVQVLAPPGGAPAPAPTSGVVIPAAGVATRCQYNATPSATIGGGTLTDALDCAVTTHTSGNDIYNGRWLRIEIALDPAYSCTSDCWWTLQWNVGAAGLRADRVTYTVKVV